MRCYAVLSDLHGNLFAFKQVLQDMKQFDIEAVILLGDLVDYGMQSNEVVSLIRDRDAFPYDILCNLRGNHEQAILCEDYTRFSSERGVESAKHTAKQLTSETWCYLERDLTPEGKLEFALDGKRCLAVHGSLEDPYWKAIAPDNVRGDYAAYDVVFSGHSHYAHVFTKFYEADDPLRRGKHAVLFINPGSVGQPRDHIPQARYALWDTDTMTVSLRAVPYDIQAAMAIYDGSVDTFYRDRLQYGV